MAGLLIGLVPTGLLAAMTPVPWERDILRLLSIVSVSIVAAWPWAAGQAREVMRRLRLWVGFGAVSTIWYLVSGGSLFLFIGFCVLTGASLDIWMRRAHMASDELRSKLRAVERRREA